MFFEPPYLNCPCLHVHSSFILYVWFWFGVMLLRFFVVIFIFCHLPFMLSHSLVTITRIYSKSVSLGSEKPEKNKHTHTDTAVCGWSPKNEEWDWIYKLIIKLDFLRYSYGLMHYSLHFFNAFGIQPMAILRWNFNNADTIKN